MIFAVSNALSELEENTLSKQISFIFSFVFYAECGKIEQQTRPEKAGKRLEPGGQKRGDNPYFSEKSGGIYSEKWRY